MGDGAKVEYFNERLYQTEDLNQREDEGLFSHAVIVCERGEMTKARPKCLFFREVWRQ